MKKLTVDLENCYGIKKFKWEFDFTAHKEFAIYAPNGAMKSSLAQVFKDIADGVASRDRIFPTRICSRKVFDENGVSLPPGNVFVVPPYDGAFGPSAKTSIPFIRNIIEYTRGIDDPGYKKLTSLLHWKDDTPTITEAELCHIYVSVFGGNGAWGGGTKTVIDTLQEEARECLKAADGINFENKIVLSIAIRLLAEMFMVVKINDPKFVSGIERNQTGKLLERFKSLFKARNDAVEILQRVVLMTPENIHVNSFMYEPILDMSDWHLRKLYADVESLE